jgi:ABC-type bacteriocin/lantibiotic exporter with double-glycine peptidase domain
MKSLYFFLIWIKYHLDKGHIIIVNWWDNIIEENKGEGHYCIVGDYKDRTITLVDPEEFGGIWSLPAKEFKRRWYDYTDLNNTTYIQGWMLWVSPASKFAS